jgi:hypothetical protein
MNHKTIAMDPLLFPCIHGVSAVLVRFSMPSYTVSEAAVMVRVAVQISSASEPVTVNVSTTDATALGKSLLS